MGSIIDFAPPILATTLSWISSLSLSAGVIFATYITSFCFTAPNPAWYNHDSDKQKQTTFRNRLVFYYTCNTAVLTTGIYHAVLCLSYPPAAPSLLCPLPSNLNPALFAWNPYSASCIAAALCSGYVLVQCFTQAGPTSNFQITVPKELVTTGIYSWTRHPGYTASFVIFLMNGAFFQRVDGVAGCWLPESVVSSRVVGIGMGFTYAGVCVFGLWALLQRVAAEESMLQETFGSKWEAYKKRTKRFIPGLV